MSLEKLELELKVKRAEVAKMELQYKIAKAMEDVERMEKHILLQDQVIKESQEKLSQLS